MIPPFRLVHTAHSEHFFNAHKAKSRLVTEKRLKSQMDGSCLDLQAGVGASHAQEDCLGLQSTKNSLSKNMLINFVRKLASRLAF